MQQNQARETRNHHHDDKALQYANLLIDNSADFAVLSAYLKSSRCQLTTVDVLEKMGISRYFVGQIKNILDMIYSRWLQKDAEIMLDVGTCAMAFRILRMNGYDVSSDELSHFSEASSFHGSLERYSSDDIIRSLLELHKASKVTISRDEYILDSIGSWSSCLLKDHLGSKDGYRTPLLQEVEYALDCPFYATLDRLEHRWNIEQFDVTGHGLKTPYLSFETNEDILALAIRDFSNSQIIYQQELQSLNRWVKDSSLDQLPFARQKLAYFYFAAAATMFSPELSDARIFWTKNGVLTTVVDDFLDIGGSKEELENLVALVEMYVWTAPKYEAGALSNVFFRYFFISSAGFLMFFVGGMILKIEYYSKYVEIVFSAIYSSVNELGAKASALQDRDVTKHIVELWLDLLKSMMTEVEWRTSNYVPTIEEYMTNATSTFALGPVVLPVLYFFGPKIPDSIVRDTEYNELFRLLSTCGRLLNDVQTYEREDNEGKVNSISLLIIQSYGSMSIEEAKRELQKPIERCREDLLRLVLKEGSVVPRPCKEVFWKMCKACHFFYSRTDGFSSSVEKAGAVDAVINMPLQLSASNAPFSLPLSGVQHN